MGDPEHTDLPYCSFDGQSDYEISADQEQLLTKCDCTLPPCSEKSYPTRLSSGAYSRKFIRQQVQLHDDITSEEEFLANFVAVTINYDVIRKVVIRESKTTTFSQLLSNLGGTMGLFAGISVLSTVEIFGDLLLLRLRPRLWGGRRLYGIGSSKWD